MITDICRLVGAAFEYRGAVKEFGARLEQGESIEDALRAFAAETESTIDDKVVDGAIEAIEELSLLARKIAAQSVEVSSLIKQASDMISDGTPDARGKVEDLGRASHEVALFLESLLSKD